MPCPITSYRAVKRRGFEIYSGGGKPWPAKAPSETGWTDIFYDLRRYTYDLYERDASR
jgi:hypothetical protein